MTGSIHCMIAPYWCKRLNKSYITSFQASERTGLLYCECAVNMADAVAIMRYSADLDCYMLNEQAKKREDVAGDGVTNLNALTEA